MDLLVKQVMRRNVNTIAPEATLPELEQTLVKLGIGGLPVVDHSELVGVVSRSDIVRQLLLEHELAENTSDFYFDQEGFHEAPLVTFEQMAQRVGERIEQVRVREVMSQNLIAVSPEQPLRYVAQTMTDRHVHRVLVTEHGRLVGIVTSLDLVRLIANGHEQPKV